MFNDIKQMILQCKPCNAISLLNLNPPDLLFLHLLIWAILWDTLGSIYLNSVENNILYVSIIGVDTQLFTHTPTIHQLTQNDNYSHGHLFSSNDISMKIPMQDRTIPMHPYIVKVEAQV